MEITIGGVLNQEDRPKCKGLHLTREQIGVCQKVAEELMKRNIPFHFEAVKRGLFLQESRFMIEKAENSLQSSWIRTLAKTL